MPMTRLAFVAVVVAPLFLNALACVRSPGPSGPPEVAALYGGRTGYELVRIPALADVQRFDVGPRTAAGTTRPTIGDAAILAGPTRPDDATIKALSDLLARAESYDFKVAKRCEFHPDVAVRFAGAKRTLDLVFCFTCGELKVSDGDRSVGHASFDPAKEQLRGLLKPAPRGAP